MRLKFNTDAFSFSKIPPLVGKFAIVTNANSETGIITVTELTKKGAYVIATSSNKVEGHLLIQKLLKTPGVKKKNVELAIVDFASMESVKQFANSYQRNHYSRKLDILVLDVNHNFVLFFVVRFILNYI